MTREDFILGALRALLGHSPDAIGVDPDTGEPSAVLLSLADVDRILRILARVGGQEYPAPPAPKPRKVDPHAN